MSTTFSGWHNTRLAQYKMEWINRSNPIISNSVYQVNYRPYRRQFRVPLQTRYGTWKERQGIIIQISDQQGRVGFGEVAPLSWFGSESLEQALAWCQGLRSRSSSSWLSGNDLSAIPDSHPACQFGIEAAITELLSRKLNSTTIPHCWLLPTGAIALQSWQLPWRQGSRVFKWKIGVASMAEELAWLKQLLQQLPPSTTLRLDANGGLDWDTACHWMEMCDRLSSSNHATIEFLEQPLPPEQFANLLTLSQQFKTAIALDESVATFHQLQTCYEHGWRGIVVIKAAIAGSPRQLLQFCQTYQLDVVWSSVFETAIARQFILNHMITVFPGRSRAIGFGTHQWFADAESTDEAPESLWASLAS